MQIRDLTTQTQFTESDHWLHQDHEYFIMCSNSEIRDLQSTFQFSDETIADCMNIDERVRFDSYESYDFISVNYFYLEDQGIKLEELNLYIGQHYVILVGKENSQLMERIRGYVLNKIKISQNAHQLLNKIYFWIFDELLSNYFFVLEELEDQIQELELEIIESANKDQFKKINQTREQINRINKYLRPLLYIGDQFLINENNFIKKESLRYFKNIDVRINKLYDFALSLKDIGDQLIYLFDSSLTSHTNEIATRLTVLAIFFGPLTVITGIYGMNFQYMPELRSPYGYPIVLGVMLFITLLLYAILKRKKWL